MAESPGGCITRSQARLAVKRKLDPGKADGYVGYAYQSWNELEVWSFKDGSRLIHNRNDTLATGQPYQIDDTDWQPMKADDKLEVKTKGEKAVKKVNIDPLDLDDLRLRERLKLISLRIPAWLLDEVDDLAQRLNTTRSKVINRLLSDRLD